MRRAEWRRRADDPKGLLGWWGRGLIDNSERTVAIVATGLPLSLLLTLFGLGSAWIVGVFAAVPFVVGVLLRLKGPDRLAPLLPNPPPQGQFRAQVSYRRDGLTTGTDEMALLFVDGWLVAEGVRSHFALRGIDVGRFTGMGDLTIELPLADGSDIRLQNIRDREGRVHVPHPLFRAWQKRAEVVEGEPTFPPAHPHPQVIAPWAFWSYVASAGIFLPSLIASWLHLGGGFSEVRIAFMLMICGASRLLWRQIGRLEKIGRRADWEDDRNALKGEAEREVSLSRPHGGNGYNASR